ncbi:UPF0489 family protein [Lentisphaerota bacterium ZTH]|nr:UPF0489 family protein [Lentisphaerota bacterium]WET05847.1 UPF0489 family protein [Lentisphaerota bacterium ZTH]
MNISNIRVENINGKPVYIAENHHEILPAIETEFNQTRHTPVMLTLDHHTDNLKAFLRSGMEFKNFSGTALEAVKLLRHDEHIDFAIQKNWIEAAVIFSHVQAVEHHPKIKVICSHDTPPYPNSPDKQQAFRHYADQVLESNFLKSRFNSAFNSFPDCLMLDIDLDYFHTAAGAAPLDNDFFYRLIRHSRFVTISCESIWVKLLKLEGETITAGSLLCKMLEHINSATRKH